MFTITISGLEGLGDVSEDIMPNKIEIFKDWDPQTNAGIHLLSQSGYWAVP